MPQALRKLAGGIRSSDARMIFINRTRPKTGVACGGRRRRRAATRSSSTRRSLDSRRISAAKMGDDVAGNEPKAKAIRDKVATSCRAAGVEILCGAGAALEIEQITPGIERGLVKKSGSWFTFGGTRVGQDCRLFLKGSPGIAKELRERVRRWRRRVIARCAGPCARWPRASARCRSRGASSGSSSARGWRPRPPRAVRNAIVRHGGEDED